MMREHIPIGDKSPLGKAVFADGSFSKADGFQPRAAKYDCAIRSADARIVTRTAEGYSGELTLDVYVSAAGEYGLRIGGGTVRRQRLVGGRPNKVAVPYAFDRLGSRTLHVSLLDGAGGIIGERDIDVNAEYEAVRIRLTTPCYRENFYPGQDCSRIEGAVDCADASRVTVTALGAGSSAGIRVAVRNGRFAFDVPADMKFPVAITATCGEDAVTRMVRKVEPDGHRMTWIEDGNVMLDGKAVFKRKIYAEGLTVGRTFAKRFAADRGSFMLTDQFNALDVAGALAKFEATECRRDVRPSVAALAAVKAVVAAAKGSNYGLVYICDEPECRGVSPVYLKHVYDYLREIDPRHVVFLSSRAGRRYVECADLLETHPYLCCCKDANGRHAYRTHPNEVGDFIDAFGCGGRPDKAVGFLNTCFSYRWDTSQNDYPTFDDYIAHSWAALAHGAKSFWPYAGHDLGDRPALYHGVRQMFRTAAALEPFLLHGTRRVLERNKETEHTVWEKDGERVELRIDFGTMKTRVSMPASCQAAIGPTLEETGRLVAQEEAARLGRDNQIRGRYDDIEFESNMSANHGGGFYKLIDGTRDVCARYSSYRTNAYVQASFTRMTPVFDKIRLWGIFNGDLGDPVVLIRKGGRWVEPRPRRVKREGLLTELDFGEALSTVRLRIEFPGKRSRRNDMELYELELPRCGTTAKAVRTAKAAAVDEGVVWKWAGETGGGFTVRDTMKRTAEIPVDASWVVIDVGRFVGKPGYRRWDAYLGRFGTLASTVTYPHPGVYTLELPPRTESVREPFQIRLWGLDVDINSVALMKTPANRVICRGPKGKNRIEPGDELMVGVVFAEPCEEVTAEFLLFRTSGRLSPYAINGTSAIELKSVDGDGRRWYAKIKVDALPSDAGARQVYVKASAMGSSFRRPVLGNFIVPFTVR